MFANIFFNIKLFYNLLFDNELMEVINNTNRIFYFNLDNTIEHGRSGIEYRNAMLAVSMDLQARFNKLKVVIDEYEIYQMFLRICENAPEDSCYNSEYLKMYEDDAMNALSEICKTKARIGYQQVIKLVNGRSQRVTCFDSRSATKILENLFLRIVKNNYDNYLQLMGYTSKYECICRSNNNKITKTVELLVKTLKGRFFSSNCTNLFCHNLAYLSRSAVQKFTKANNKNNETKTCKYIVKKLTRKSSKKEGFIELDKCCNPQCAGVMSKHLKQVVYFTIDRNYKAFEQPAQLVTELNEYALFNYSPNNIMIIHINLYSLIIQEFILQNSMPANPWNDFNFSEISNSTTYTNKSRIMNNVILFIEKLIKCHYQNNYFIIVLKKFCAPEQDTSKRINIAGRNHTIDQLKNIYKLLKQKIKDLCCSKLLRKNVFLFKEADFNYETILENIRTNRRVFGNNKYKDACACELYLDEI
ncbi:hypothetical protein THOM_3220 [Trachipleistophora hominis]|uniref:Uncharacterized protein n=1 Tax=Trachipleistophora hominis TaxID=72359 RepID=L7JRD9_TRAHO|nr:hypothetical protein THOM_3220 [Trachipleistophora hominis]